MEEKLKQIIKDKIKSNYNIDLNEIKLDIPPKKELWDFAFGCFVLSRELKKSPDVISQELSLLFNDVDLIASVTNFWPHLNIRISKNIYSDIFNELYKNKEKIIWNKESNNKKIVIDYIWPNVWKPLHIGHMCTPNQWQVLVNLYRKLGYTVIADTHIWDWWIIFGKLITAYKLWWDKNKLKENAVDYLLELYIKITEEIENWIDLEQRTRDEFKLLSKWNPESVELWKEFTSYSIKALQVQLDRLNIKADYNIGESFYEWLHFPKMEDYPDLKFTMSDIVEELIKKWIATKNDDNSVWVEFDEKTKIPSCILQKRDWTHWYLASDLAAIKYRMDNWNPFKIVYFTDSRQQLHFKQAFEIAKKASWLNETELFHAFNWFISLKDWAMSTRKGRIIRLDSLLDEAELRAKNIILEKRDDIQWVELEELAKIIWIWAIKYGYLKKSRDTDVIFDWDEFMTFEWNSGPYIQYAYVRAIRILEKSVDENVINSKISSGLPQGKPLQCDSSDAPCGCNDYIWLFEYSEEIELIKLINSYDDVLDKTAKTNMPHHLCSFSYELTKAFNSFYNTVHILSEVDEKKKLIRLQLVELFSLVLKDSFKLLGIEMPEKM